MRKWLLLLILATGPLWADPQVPPVYRGTDTAGPVSVGDFEWFKVFQDSQLQALVRTALQQNPDLRTAMARVEAAEANLGITHAKQSPDITLTADYNSNGVTTNSPGFFKGLEPRTVTLGGLVLNLLSYEIDVWGRLRNQTNAARLQLVASAADRQAVMSVVVSDVASDYFNLIEMDAELDIERRTLATRLDSLNIITAREQGGLATMLDVRQGQELVDQAQITMTQTQQHIEDAENNLELLLGNPPAPVTRATLVAQTEPPEVPAGLPSTLLFRRPDIRSAEANLEATRYLVKSARAAFLPEFSLTGFLGLQSSRLANLFTRGSYENGINPTISGALSPREALQANLALARANQKVALIQYEASVVTALHDVSNALVDHAAARELRTQQEALVQTLQERSRLAYLRYNGGVDTLLNALDADRDLFNAQLSAAQARRDELLTLVQLYRALGGGWQP
ncbi:MAG TPA: efflux transporter outer membrane subunit [Candidatus Xenobia bacterium]|jgi:multidrug efflux system outer membrane protein